VDVRDPLTVAAEHQPAHRKPDGPPPGVNLVGFLEAESGLGEIARRLARTLERAGIPFAAIPFRRTTSRQQHDPGIPLADSARYDTNLICLNADVLPSFAAEVGVEFFARRHSIGFWFWETDVFRSDDRAALRLLDEVWVASDYVRGAIEPEADIPVRVVPVPLGVPSGPFLSRAELDLPDGFLFCCVFDFVSGERKNPSAVVDAFAQAFVPGEGPTLVLKSINGQERKPRSLAALRAAASGRDDVIVRDGFVSPAERDSYLDACDCYVSLHRSEGLGLTMAEAMALGKPVVATGYSGNLAFMDERNSHLVPYRLVDVPEDWWAHEPGAQWAEPDVAAAAVLMRQVWEDQGTAGALGALARVDVLERFSVERTADAVTAHLADAPRSRHDRAASALVEASLLLAEGAGAGLSTKPTRWPTSRLRAALLRLLWPQLARQQRVDDALVEAVADLRRSVRALERDDDRATNPPRDV
jgi:glycosyltransferase involved in cell wall biosynthesis